MRHGTEGAGEHLCPLASSPLRPGPALPIPSLWGPRGPQAREGMPVEAVLPGGALRPLRAREHALAFGVVGLATEVAFTAVAQALAGRGGARLRGSASLWMPPLWAAGGLLCQRAGPLLRARRRGVLTRGAVYAALCLGVESTAGALLRAWLGRCPWERHSARSRWSVQGLIRLDHAPLWAAAGLLGERLCAGLSRVRLAPRPHGPRLRELLRPGCNAADPSALPLPGAGTGAGGDEARLPAEALRV